MEDKFIKFHDADFKVSGKEDEVALYMLYLLVRWVKSATKGEDTTAAQLVDVLGSRLNLTSTSDIFYSLDKILDYCQFWLPGAWGYIDNLRTLFQPEEDNNENK